MQLHVALSIVSQSILVDGGNLISYDILCTSITRSRDYLQIRQKIKKEETNKNIYCTPSSP